METFYNVAIFMPFAVCVIWCVMGFLKLRKSVKTWMSNLLLVHACIYLYASTGFLATPANYDMFPVYDVLCMFSGLSIVPFMWFYLISLKGLRSGALTRSLVVIMVLTMGIVSLTLYFMLGKEEAVIYYYHWLNGGEYRPSNPELSQLLKIVTTYVYRCILVLELVFFFVYIVWDMKGIKHFLSAFKDYFWLKKTVSVYNSQMVMIVILLAIFFLRAGTPEIYLSQHHEFMILISVVEAVVIAIISYTTLFNDVKEISIVDFFSPVVPSSALDEIPEAMMPQDEPVLSSTDNAFGLHVNSEEEFSYTQLPDNVLIPLRESFKVYMEEEKRFLEKGITLSKIAEDIHSNKNYVSRMVHITYDMTFPDYLNKKRIDYAKTLLLGDPNIKQEVLADECGFANASAFNRAFKRETNNTPRMWLVEQKND